MIFLQGVTGDDDDDACDIWLIDWCEEAVDDVVVAVKCLKMDDK